MNLVFAAHHIGKKSVKRGPKGATNGFPISFPLKICLTNIIRVIVMVYWSFRPKIVFR